MMRVRRRWALMASGSVLALMLPGWAMAAAAAADQGASATSVQELVVTAEKRAEPLKDVPMSVTAVTGVTLDNLQQRSFADYAASVPGLSLASSSPGITRLTLRGENAGGVGSTVSTYVDESPFGSSTALLNGSILTGDFDTFDLARIEVLRGPQGTLYGANSEGGLIKFVTNPPSVAGYSALVEATGEAVEHGDDDGSVHAMFNAPIGHELAVRVDGFYQSLPGYIDDPALNLKNLNNGRKDGFRASVLFAPSDNLTVRLTAFGQETLNHGTPDVDVNPATLEPVVGDLEQQRSIRERSDFKYQNYSGVVTWNMGSVNLVSATSYGVLDTYQFLDATPILGAALSGIFGQPLGAFEENDTHLKKFTQEVRLASTGVHRIDWQVGGYYTRETGQLPQYIDGFSLSTFAVPPGLAGLEVVGLASSYDEWAGFGTLTFHLSDQFDIQAGGRYAHNSQSATESVSGPLAGAPVSFTTPSSGNVFTYSIAPRWHLNADTLIYARVATGYRPGGPNALPPSAPPSVEREYGADRTTNYEIGLRTELLDHRLSIDVAAYHINWKNIQLLEVINNFGINANGGTAQSDGLEYTVEAVPVDGLTLRLDGAVNDAHLTSVAPAANGASGDPLPYAPKFSESFDGEYDFALAAGWSGYVGSTLSYVGDRYSDFSPTGQTHLPGYTTADARIGARAGRFDFQIYAKNLTDSRGITSYAGPPAAPNGAGAISVIQPRTVGVQVTARF